MSLASAFQINGLGLVLDQAASRHGSAKALTAFAGLCPQQRLSGTSVKGRTLVSKRGHADLRKALYIPGMLAMRLNALVQDMAQRLKAKGMAPKGTIAAAMHKLIHSYMAFSKRANRLICIGPARLTT